MKYISYGKQLIDYKDKKLVLTSLSNNLITTGPFVDKFEKELKKYLNCKFSYVCSSGTAAIHLAMLSIDLKKGDIILMPAVNFIASFNMAKTIGLKIFLVDVDQYTGQVTPETVLECINKNKLKKIHALITMLNGGYPLYSKKFYDIKKKYNFYIIEDACHALGSEYKYREKYYKVGSCKHADVSTFSMHPLKTITSGEGGIITTNSRKISKKILLFRNHGIIRNKKKYWDYDIVKNGFNYRLSDINCALGFSQLKKINYFLKKRKNIFDSYSFHLKNLSPYINLPRYSEDSKNSYHLFILNVNFQKIKKSKDSLFKYLIKKKILPQYHYIPIYKFSIFGNKKFKFIGSEQYFNNSISLPIFVNLKSRELNKVINALKQYFK